MKRPLYLAVILLGIGALAGGTVVYFTTRPGQTTSSPDGPEGTAQHSPESTPPNMLGAEDWSRLPKDRVLLPPNDEAECRGLVVSGHSQWGVGSLRQKSVLWDEGNRHLVVLLPNETLEELQEHLSPK
jgi:hypothetical protein